MTDDELHSQLKALGVGVTKYQFDTPDFLVLEKFPNPHPLARVFDEGTVLGASKLTVSIDAPEFTSLCPKTGQPDFATIVIKYKPKDWCVESKSLKLYLMGFRNHGEFHEACVNRIGYDLVRLLDPIWLQVTGQFSPRGGISFWPTYFYRVIE